jgi:Concanavalin A-like lectin/glucanases superfamily
MSSSPLYRILIILVLLPTITQQIPSDNSIRDNNIHANANANEQMKTPVAGYKYMATTTQNSNNIPGSGVRPAGPYLTLTGLTFADIGSNSSLQLAKFSVSAWFRTNMNIPFGNDIFIIKKGELGLEDPGTNLNYGIWMTASETLSAGFESTNGTNYYIHSRVPYNNYQWHHVVATYDGSALRLYVDGLQVVKSIITDGAIPDNTGTDSLRVGAESSLVEFLPRDNFVGNIDDVRVWNRGITSAEIANGYRTGVFNTTGQVVYLPFG